MAVMYLVQGCGGSEGSGFFDWPVLASLSEETANNACAVLDELCENARKVPNPGSPESKAAWAEVDRMVADLFPTITEKPSESFWQDVSYEVTKVELV